MGRGEVKDFQDYREEKQGYEGGMRRRIMVKGKKGPERREKGEGKGKRRKEDERKIDETGGL
jgi:hypothetical protein